MVLLKVMLGPQELLVLVIGVMRVGMQIELVCVARQRCCWLLYNFVLVFIFVLGFMFHFVRDFIGRNKRILSLAYKTISCNKSMQFM